MFEIALNRNPLVYVTAGPMSLEPGQQVFKVDIAQ
jgi:hypothetical protein